MGRTLSTPAAALAAALAVSGCSGARVAWRGPAPHAQARPRPQPQPRTTPAAEPVAWYDDPRLARVGSAPDRTTRQRLARAVLTPVALAGYGALWVLANTDSPDDLGLGRAHEPHHHPDDKDKRKNKDQEKDKDDRHAP